MANGTRGSSYESEKKGGTPGNTINKYPSLNKTQTEEQRRKAVANQKQTQGRDEEYGLTMPTTKVADILGQALTKHIGVGTKPLILDIEKKRL